MSDPGTRSRKGMRGGISSLKECPEGMWEQELGGPKKTDPAEDLGKKHQADLWGMEWGGGRHGWSQGWRSGERTPSSVR